MIGRALNSGNDLVLLNGQIAVVEDGLQTVQHVRTRLLFYLGEWFLDTLAGTPWFEEVFVRPVNLATVESVIKTRILETPGITGLTDFLMDYDRPIRKLRVLFSATTDFGDLTNVELFINNSAAVTFNG